MSVTIIQMSPDELQGMLDKAVQKAVEHAATRSGETWRVSDLAAHYGVSERTINNREHRGELPPRSGPHWRKSDVLQWDRDRAMGALSPH